MKRLFSYYICLNSGFWLVKTNEQHLAVTQSVQLDASHAPKNLATYGTNVLDFHISAIFFNINNDQSPPTVSCITFH